MTRLQKINKLSNAIKVYRGAYHPETGKWIRPPQHLRQDRVRAWLEQLGLNVRESMDRIDEFRNMGEFEKWIRAI